MLLLEPLQLVEEPVVLGVGDLRVVEDVVAVEVVVQELAQLLGTRSRRRVLERGKQLLRRLDDGVRLLRLEPLARVDAAPRDRDRVHARRLRGADVERRVADVDGIVALGVEQRERVLSGAGSGLCRSVSSEPTTTSKKRSSGR